MSRNSSMWLDYQKWLIQERLNLLPADADPDDTLRIDRLANATPLDGEPGDMSKELRGLPIEDECEVCGLPLSQCNCVVPFEE